MRLRQGWRNRQEKDNIPKKWLQYESLRIRRGSISSLVEKIDCNSSPFSIVYQLYFKYLNNYYLNIFAIVEFPKDKISHQPDDS